MRARIPLSAVVLASLLVSASARAAEGSPPPADVAASAREWDALTNELIRRERQGPLAAARVIGVMGLALHEAARPAHPHEPSLAARAGVAGLPAAEGEAAGALSVAAAATLRSLLAERGPDAKRAIASLEKKLAPESGPARERGLAIAAAVSAWESGLRPEGPCSWRSRKERGCWEAAPPDFRAKPLGACWGERSPMALSSPRVPIDPPTPYSEEPGSPFHREAAEVRDAVARQDPAEQEIALFWSDDQGATGTPPAHWLAILDQVGVDRAVDPASFLRARAVLGVALHDASIACWSAKYETDAIRPITYIQRFMDPAWVPLLVTPPFPEYPSGHSVFSAAAATVLVATVGDGPFEDRTRASRGHASRRFESFGAAAREAALSRVLGGIHFRPACENGLEQGAEVGRRVLKGLGLPD